MKIPEKTQEPITTDVPLGLDEPAPILVWKRCFSGESLVQACFLTKDACLGAGPAHGFRPTDAMGEPLQLTLESVLSWAKSVDAIKVVVYDDSLRAIEEYPL